MARDRGARQMSGPRVPPWDGAEAACCAIEQGSFTAAAKELGITQVAVSSRIAKLEHFLGYKIFDRRLGARTTSPTMRGMVMYGHLKEFVDFDWDKLSISQIDAADPNCVACRGFGWVCENHRDKPWEGMLPKSECCGGAGAPCKCNPLSKN